MKPFVGGILLLAAFTTFGQAAIIRGGNIRPHDDVLQQRRALMGMREKRNRSSSSSSSHSNTKSTTTTSTTDIPEASSKGSMGMMGKKNMLEMLEEQALDCKKTNSCPTIHSGALDHIRNATASDEAMMKDTTEGKRQIRGR